jgi:hypothetical protein
VSLSQLINRTCVLLVRTESTTLDADGDPVMDEASVETVCEMQPRSAIEPQNSDLSEEDWVGWWFPADRDFLDSASLAWVPELGEFEIVGMPPTWRNPRTQTDEFIQANTRRTSGPEDTTGS